MEREIRKGNLVKGIGINIQCTVEGIHDGFIFSSGHWRVLSSFEPIPLTEEWLIKFGFIESCEVDEDQEEFYIFTKDSVSIYNSAYSNQFYLDSNGIVFGFTGESKINNVHQLQNLYFALTGQELEIHE